MSTITLLGLDRPSALGHQRRISLVWLGWFLALLGLTVFVGLVLLYFGPTPTLIAWLIYFCGAAAILYNPRYGIYLILFFALIADGVLSPWYPFIKNFSSAESIFYLQNSLIISPLETYLVLTFASWLVRPAMRRNFHVFTGTLFWAGIIFIMFTAGGLVYGWIKGGSLNIGLWEARPIFYLPAMLVLVSNLIRTRQQLNTLMGFIMAALVIEGLNGSYYFFSTLKGNLENVEAITEHSAAIHMNTLFIFVAAAWIFHASTAKRYLLPLAIPIVALSYIATQRRAAFLSLAIALAVLAGILYLKQRKKFWYIVPSMAVVLALYVGAFWTTTSAVGLPAQAIKSIVAEDQASQEDQQSNYYRFLENINSSFTIHMAPLIGVGFGNKFFVLIPMPNISWFIWWEYITHNSIIWIWIKTGVGGFMALIYLIGLSMYTGARTVRIMPGGDMSVIALTASLYLLMHFIFAYVDMSWDIQSMLYVGAMMGVINSIERIVSQKLPLPKKRWPWQPDPTPLPDL